MDPMKDALKKKMQGFKSPQDEKSMDMAPPRGGIEEDDGLMESAQDEQKEEMSKDDIIKMLLQALSDKSHPQRDAMSLGESVADNAKMDLGKLK